MIDLYYWPTPNGWKISIALEEMELPYLDLGELPNVARWYDAMKARQILSGQQPAGTR